MIPQYSERVQMMKRSEIRELLKLTAKPEMISFAGGLPNPEAFPVEIIRQLSHDVLEEDYISALQYGTTEGFVKFRQSVSKYMKKNQDSSVTADEIVITSGAQQGLELVGKVFIDKGDTVLLGKPSYLGAISAFTLYQPKFVGITLDNDGLKIDELRQVLKKEKPTFIYTVPTFQNPMGVTMPLERRKELIEIANDKDLIIVEDNPYSELRYSGKPIPPLKSLDTEGRVIYLGTLSKMLAPGFRMGWTAANPEIIDKIVMAKQGTDLCTNTFAQYVAYKFMDLHLESHLKKINDMYSRKRKLMLDALEDYLGDSEIKWTKPEGGMFLWMTLPENMSSRDLFKICTEKYDVAFVPGDAFFFDSSGKNTARINYTYATDEQISEGVSRIAKGIKEL